MGVGNILFCYHIDMIIETFSILCAGAFSGTMGVIVHCIKTELDLINDNIQERLDELEERLKQ